MAAGLAMLEALNSDQEIYTRLSEKTKLLEAGFKEVLSIKKLPYQINRLGSMISLHFTEKPVIDFETAYLGNNKQFNNYFQGMLNEGVYLPPSAFESYFLNDALTFKDINRTIEAFERVVKKL